MEITRGDASLHLDKWLAEETLINVCLSFPGVDAQCCFGGNVTAVADKLVFSHPKGNSEAYLACSWHEVDRIEYVELREAASKLNALPGAADFMRERTNLILILKGGMAVLLTDLSR